MHLMQLLTWPMGFGIDCIPTDVGTRIPGHVGKHQHCTCQTPSRQSETAKAIRISYMVSLSAHFLSHFLGKFSTCTAALAISPAPLFYCWLQRDLQVALNNSNQDYKVQLSLSQSPKKNSPSGENKSSQIERKAPKGQVRSSYHTSLLGKGAACVENCTDGAWSVQKHAININCLELLAAMLAAKTFLNDVSGVSVLLHLINATAAAYFNNMASQLTDLVKELWMWALNKDIILTARHIQAVSNTVADMEFADSPR